MLALSLRARSGLFCVVLATGCTVGSGSGAISGPVFIEDCKDLGTRAEPKEFNLKPSFFAGEPIEDIRESGTRTNRLVIRLQRGGGSIEANDGVFFDIVDLYQVARCLRGREIMNADGTLVPDYDPEICFVRDGVPPRIRVGATDFVRASFIPAHSCNQHGEDAPVVVGTAVSCTGPNGCQNVAGGGWESWIEFESFGSARQADRAPVDRDPIRKDFTIDFDQRLRASHLELRLEDDRVVNAGTGKAAAVVGKIGGTLSGWFDFDLERGRATQTFP